MPRYATSLLLAFILLNTLSPARPQDPTVVLAEDVSQAPFVLSVPTSLIRANNGLQIVMHDDGAGQGLIFTLGPDEIVVTLRRGGEATELARAQAPLPADGGAVVLKRPRGGIAVAYGAVTVLRMDADLPDGGRWGVTGAPAAALDEIVLQPLEEVSFRDDFMRMPDEPSAWEDLGGQWRVAQLESARYSANAFTLLGRATGPEPGLTAAGYWFFEDLTVEASVRPSPEAAGFGIGLACHPDGSCYLLRFIARSGPLGALQLVRLHSGTETILDEAPIAVDPDDWHRLALSGIGGRLTGTLNGIDLLSVEDPQLAHGQVALWVSGPDAVAFDDVEAYSGPRETSRPVALSLEAQSADPGAQPFIGDQYMQQWADESAQWLFGVGGLWHAGHYFGDVELSWELDQRALGEGAGLHICVPAAADTFRPPTDAQAGCHLDILPAAEGRLSLALREGLEARGQQAIDMPELPATATLRRVGDTVEALVNGEVVGSFAATVPAAGKVGITSRNARWQARNLSILTRNLVDSTFRAAPTEWTIGSGEWGVSSRWDCSPRWSWFQGHSEDLASVWTRRRFGGDLVVEFFAGMSMDQPWAPFYRHPGNICVTLCGSNETPGSGYSLVFGGWGNSAAGLFRRGELVAKAPGFVMPDVIDSLGGTSGREDAHKLHNEWRRIRAEKLGNTVRLIVDGRQALVFTDPDPLPDGAVGIWTLNQGMAIARARIYHQGGQYAMPEVAAPTVVRSVESLPLPRFGPSRVVSAFEQGTDGWAASSPGSCALTRAQRNTGGGVCLQVINSTAGGSFALAMPLEGIDLRKHPLLAFEYAIPDDVHIDLYAVVDGQRYRVLLSGPPEPAPGIEDVGSVPDVRADGRWREARVDLLGLLAPHFPADAPIIPRRIEFAAHAVDEYMRAGIGGNPAAATWRLDNVYLGGVTAASVELRAPGNLSVQASGCSLTGGAGAGLPVHKLSPRRSGLAAIGFSAGARSAADLLAFDIDPPTLQPLEPQAGAAWLGPLLTVAVADTGPAGIDERSLAISVDDRRFDLANPALRWLPAEGKLTLDLREADLQPAPDHAIDVTVTASDRAGNAAAPLRLSFTPDRAADTTPPDPPTLIGAPPAQLDCDFETDMGPLQPWGVDAGVALRRARGPVADNPRGGGWCLEAKSTKLGGLFGVSIGVAPFDASRYPILEFDYRVPPELRVDLIIEVDGSRRVIKFTDNDQTWPVIGRVGAVVDNQWHRATVDLGGLLERAFRRAAPLVVTDLAFATSGWPGVRENTRWWLDNIRLSAAINVSDIPDGLALHSRDESGIARIAWTAGASRNAEAPAGPPPGELREALAGHAAGLVWLGAEATDGAGNGSGVALIPVRLVAGDDTTPPVASSPSPADGAAACPSTISVTLADDSSGVSPADLRLGVNGNTWTIADEALSWDAKAGLLTWSLPPGVVFGPDGARVNCRLEAGDLAGNALEPLEWAFTLDYSLDDQPPAAPVVSYIPARAADANDFEQHTGGWGDFIDGQVVRRADGGATGPGCIELRHLATRRGGSGFVLVRDFGENWRESPIVRFRYRAVNAPRAGLQVSGTTFDGAHDLWTELATLPVTGQQWQTAEIDIAKALARTDPSLDIHRIFLNINLPPDGRLLIDDYAMYSPAATQAGFRWSAPASPSGIAGYSWVLHSASDTLPPEAVMGAEPRVEFTDLAPGRYVFHLRACTNSGAWSPPSHVAFELIAVE